MGHLIFSTVLSCSLQASALKFPVAKLAKEKHDAWFAFPTSLSIIPYSHLTADSLQITSPS